MANSKKSGYSQSVEMRIVPIEEIPRSKKPLPTNIELYKVCYNMKALCQETDGVGLHAFQVGLPWDVFVFCCEDGNYESYIECGYVPIGEAKVPSIEGCLSLPGRRFNVERYEKIRLKGKQLVEFELIDIDRNCDGLYSIVMQHEIDHGKNVLISDIGTEIHIN